MKQLVLLSSGNKIDEELSSGSHVKITNHNHKTINDDDDDYDDDDDDHDELFLSYG